MCLYFLYLRLCLRQTRNLADHRYRHSFVQHLSGYAFCFLNFAKLHAFSHTLCLAKLHAFSHTFRYSVALCCV